MPNQAASVGCFVICFLELALVSAYLSPQCCGDNFCCMLASDGSIRCWGGNTFSSPSGTFKAIACGGKTLAAVGSDGKLAACAGTEGYGASECAALVGTAVLDVSVSFWGGSVIKDDNSIASWSHPTAYGAGSCFRPTAEECASTCSSCNAVDISLTPPMGSYEILACGGKRAGHFCCAAPVAGDVAGDAIVCWGDSMAKYTPTASHLTGAVRPYQMSAGCDFICTLTGEGVFNLYGYRDAGELGSSSHPDTQMPPASASGPFKQAACGTFAVYLVDYSGGVTAYGRIFGSDVGPVDAGTSTVDIPTGVEFSFVAANSGFGHGCGITSSLTPQCWGADYSKQVSDAPSNEVAASPYLWPSLLTEASPTPAPTPSPTPSTNPSPTPAPSPETITGYIYCDNYFEFYFNGQAVKTDPLDFTPHQAVKVSFEYDGTSSKTFAILCQDYASDSGYEYTQTSSPQLGDGALLAEFSDGTVTSADWKAYVATFGPTDASVSNGCSASNLDACVIQDNGIPQNWYTESFDDSAWSAATEYTADEAGWGRTPSYSGGMCGTITSPLTKEDADPSSLATTEDECLNPKTVLCGGDETCSGSDGRMIWGTDMERDNKMLFRYTVSGSSDPTPAPMPGPTPSPTPGPTPAPTPAPSPSQTTSASDAIRASGLSASWHAAALTVLAWGAA